MPITAKASRFRFANGAGQEGAPNSLIVAEKGGEVPVQSLKGNLYVLVEPMGGSPDDPIVSQVLGLIRKTYFATRGPITSSLRAALAAANDHLFQHNLNLPPAESRDVAACCMVLRGAEAIIARVGPCVAYHVRGAQWQRFPAPDAENAGAPLGLRKEPDIAYHAAQIAAGDLLLLVESRGAQLLAPGSVKAPAGAAVTATLRAAAQKADFACLLVELSGERAGAATPAEKAAPPRRKAEPAAAAVPEMAVREEETATPPPSGGHKVEKRRRPASRLALLLAVLIPLLVAGGILGYNWYRGRQIETGFTADMLEANAQYNTARTTSDSEVARASLAKAQAALKLAQEVHPEDQAVVRLGKDIQVLDDKLRLVTPVYWMAELYRFVNPGSAPRRLAVSGNDLYVLDAGNSVVTRHVLNDLGDGLERGQENIEVVRKGQQLGSIVVGNLIDLTWMPAGGDWEVDSLLILDASGHIIVYTKEGGLTAQTLPGTLRTPLVLGSYLGARLYVLDPGAAQVLRYTPSANGYVDPPESYFPEGAQLDLTTARDMAIDGDLWLLYADHLERYQQGLPVAFEMQGLDQPFSSPAGIFTAPDDGASPVHNVYVADTGNGRIVKLTKDGRFVRQYRPPEGPTFTEIHDLYVDEAHGRLYFVAGGSLYLADVPQEESTP